MEVTYYLFHFLMVLLICAGMDGLQSGNVLPLGTIKKVGIRRPLMRNDQPNGIYLKSDQRQPPPPLTLRTHYYPLPVPPPPHRRLQPQHQLNKQQGFIIRNSIGRHPPRPAPVSINNHLGALAGGNNPGRGKFHHANRQQQPLKQQHLNHQFQTVNMPTNIHYNNKQQTSNHQQQQNWQIETVRQPDPPVIVPHTNQSPKEESDPSKTMMSDDVENILKFELEGNDYLTYLYLGMNETRLDGEEYPSLKQADKVTHPPTDDDDIIIGSPTMHFDPYLSRNQSFRSKSSADVADHDRTMNENIIKSLDDDWLPITSPWDKYGNKSESKLQ